MDVNDFTEADTLVLVHEQQQSMRQKLEALRRLSSRSLKAQFSMSVFTEPQSSYDESLLKRFRYVRSVQVNKESERNLQWKDANWVIVYFTLVLF